MTALGASLSTTLAIGLSAIVASVIAFAVILLWRAFLIWLVG